MAGAGFALDEVRIVERTMAWTAPATTRGYQLTFVRRGRFRIRLNAWEGLVDPVTAYLGRPDDEQRIAHRPATEDVCAVLDLDPPFVAELLDGRPVAPGPRRVTAKQALAQRTLAHTKTGFELAERVTELATALLTQQPPEPATTSPYRRKVVDQARERLHAGPTGFAELARELNVSRGYLSRVFHDETGETLTSYRNRVRVGTALDRIDGGETDLAALAAELGFADHPHLTRTMKTELGLTPRDLRRLLGDKSSSRPARSARR